MENFTPYSALIGGSLIGIAGTLLLLFNGRIAGVSGILDGALFGPKTEKLWRWYFIVGLITGSFLVNNFAPGFNSPREGYPLLLIAVGGVFVGFGARMASGCISGHGVCGLSRLSIRSLTATSVFIASAMVTIYFVRHLFGVSA